MAGHMGNNKVTTRGLKIVMVDPERNIVMVRGSVPGARNTLVRIERANDNY
jgi:large subunit ribosomal protein L3